MYCHRAAETPPQWSKHCCMLFHLNLSSCVYVTGEQIFIHICPTFLRSKCHLFPNRDISWYIDFIIQKSDWLICGNIDFLKNNHCGYKIFHTQTEQKRWRVFVSADGQLDAAESFCVSDLGASSAFSGSLENFLLTHKTNLIHPSIWKVKYKLITCEWKFNPLALMQNQLDRSLLTVWSFTICG